MALNAAGITLRYFNPHSPCGERLHADFAPFAAELFQSTLPLRGATRARSRRCRPCFYFNPHSPCGERRARKRSPRSFIEFQSTLPLRGATFFTGSSFGGMLFQSTLPLRGATVLHALHVRPRSDFNPHSPCGERPWFSAWMVNVFSSFQSTLPLRGATAEDRGAQPQGLISIHTPLAGSDMV